MERSQPALFDALQHRMFCLDPFKRSAATVCIHPIFYLLFMLRCPARVFEDMKTLCRKYFPRQLSEIEGLLNVSSANSVADEEELEDEGADSQATLRTVAAETVVEKDGVREEWGETDGEEQASAEDKQKEVNLDMKSNPEAMNTELTQEVHGKETQEVTDKSETTVEKDQTAVLKNSKRFTETLVDFPWKNLGAP